MAVKIAITNQKGGVGKTTTAICLAQELKRRKKKVLFVDADVQFNATQFYQAKYEGEATVTDILCDDTPAEECIQHTDFGDIIASDELVETLELKVAVDEMRFFHLKEALEQIEDKYDYIVIDTPPVIGVVLKNALNAADFAVVPVMESGWSISGVMKLASAIKLASKANPKLKTAGIITVCAEPHYKRQSKDFEDKAENIAEMIGTIRFKTKVRKSTACKEAMAQYFVPLHEYKPNCTTTKDYKDFTTELLGVIKKHG